MQQWLFCLENIVDIFWVIMFLFRSWNRRDKVEWSAKARKPLGSGLQGFRGNLIQSSDGPQKHLLEWYAKASKGSPWTLQQAIGNGCQYPLGITQWFNHNMTIATKMVKNWNSFCQGCDLFGQIYDWCIYYIPIGMCCVFEQSCIIWSGEFTRPANMVF